MSRQRDTPSPSGSRTSRIATSGTSAGMRAGAGRQAGLAHHLDVGLGLEELTDAPADDLMVVEQEHPDLAAARPGVLRRTAW